LNTLENPADPPIDIVGSNFNTFGEHGNKVYTTDAALPLKETKESERREITSPSNPTALDVRTVITPKVTIEVDSNRKLSEPSDYKP
jgi:hypothetical protein